ncbi:MAG: enoyl-CoA hydratase-related protein [Thermoplasmata archaeon]|nr:enoyl-CoA hydratase-related protein [Thermoplasmata archaeon]
MAVRIEEIGAVLRVTIDRPEVLNAIDPETHDELLAAWYRFRDEDRFRVAILTGAGDRAFSAGIDLRRMGDFYRGIPPDRRREVWDREPGIGGITRNLDVGKPIVAAINGHCLGGGMELALACDIRICSLSSTFGLPEVRWAIIPGQGGTQRLPRSVPANVALEMILTGRPIDAARALQIGLVNSVHAKDALPAAALELAQAIAAQPARAVRHAREAVLRGLELPLSEGLRLEQSLAEPLRDSEENRAARAKFAQPK